MMPGEEAPAFVDNNVLVYAFDRGDGARRERASKLIEELGASGRLRLSTQVFQEFLVTATRKAKVPLPMGQALEILDALSRWPVFQVDVPAVLRAGELTRTASLSFWDALVVVSASRSGASVLYSEDMNSGEVVLGVRIVNPFQSVLAPA